MPKEYSRVSRVAEVIQRELSIIVQREMRDPRLGMITIIDVEVTKDLKIAKVYFSLLEENDERIQNTCKVLNEASGFLRKQVAQRVKLRTTPSLSFVYDDTLLKGNRLHKLIDDAVKQDKSSAVDDDTE